MCLVASRARDWHKKLVTLAVDINNVRIWVNTKGARYRIAHFLMHVLRFSDARYVFQLAAVYIQTYHNFIADFITRTDDEGFDQMKEDQ